MKKIVLYFKLQYKLLFSFIALIIVPFYILMTMEMKIPNLPYFFLLLLAALKFIVFKKRSTHKNIKLKAVKSLVSNNGKNPSNNMIIKRSQEIIEAQDSVIVFTGLGIIFISIILNGF